MISRGNRLPLFGERHHATSIKHTEAEQMIKLESNSVHCPMKSVFSIVKRVTLRRKYGQMLDITPGVMKIKFKLRNSIFQRIDSP